MLVLRGWISAWKGVCTQRSRLGDVDVDVDVMWWGERSGGEGS